MKLIIFSLIAILGLCGAVSDIIQQIKNNRNNGEPKGGIESHDDLAEVPEEHE